MLKLEEKIKRLQFENINIRGIKGLCLFEEQKGMS